MEVLVHPTINVRLWRIEMIIGRHYWKMSRLSNRATHSSLFRKFFKWYQIIGDFLFKPTCPYKIAFIIGPFSHLKPPSVLQNRSYKREIVTTSDKELEVGGLERRVSWETFFLLLSYFLSCLFVHRALAPGLLSFKLWGLFSLLGRGVSSRCCNSGTWRWFNICFNRHVLILSTVLVIEIIQSYG